MKAKKILTLASIFAGAAVVGTTFATWAVTDNADPFGIKISPSDIKTDVTELVTLEYGERVFADVANLEVGKPRLGATVGLKATTTTSTTYTGHFDLSLINQTEKEEGAKLLYKYLNVDVYSGTIVVDDAGVVTSVEGATKLGHIPTEGDTPEYNVSINVTCNSGIAKTVYVVVSINESASPVLEEIKSDVVYLQMDWNSNGEDEVKATKVYFERKGKVGDVYCYAWGNGSQNGAFPGVKMESAGSNIYTYELNTTYDEVIFSDVTKVSGQADVVNYQTEDLEITMLMRNQTPFYGIKTEDPLAYEWKAAPVIEDLTCDYYLVGDKKNGWKPSDLKGLGLTSSDEVHYLLDNVQFAENEEFKICSADMSGWYGRTAGDEYVDVLEGGNLKVKVAGAYKVNFTNSPTDGNYVWITPVTNA